MASDSSELTFVRCSSCRSLVPAVSTRCRMCGAPLDAAGGDDATASQEDDQDTRVRQRTNSGQGGVAIGGPGGMREARSGAVSEPPAVQEAAGSTDDVAEVAPAPSPVDSQPISEVEQVVDPLGLHADAGAGKSSEAETSSSGGFEDPLSAYIQEVSVEESASSGAQNGQDNPQLTPEASAAATVEEPEQKSPFEPTPRVTVESGGRSKGRGSSLSFGKQAPQEEAPQEKTPQKKQSASKPFPEEVERQPEPEERTLQKSKPKADRSQQRRDEPQVKAEPALDKPARESQESEEEVVEARIGKKKRSRRRSKKSGSQDFENEDREHAAPQREAQRATQRKPVQAAGVQNGRLFGWLVDYSDGIGSSIELREGKFFVSGSQLKPSDLVLDDPSVSTPHAMVQVSPAKGFVVQDLMSENGVYLRRRGQKDFVKEEEAIDLENGDVIRFGDVEFVVSLIAEVGVK